MVFHALKKAWTVLEKRGLTLLRTLEVIALNIVVSEKLNQFFALNKAFI